MSTVPSQTPAAAVVKSPEPVLAVNEIRIVSHCTLFYWWPVWAVGFLMAIISLMTNQRMVMVNDKADFFASAKVSSDEKTLDNVRAWAWQPAKNEATHTEKLHISPNKNLGVLFSIILLVVIAITNIPLRGLWSVIVMVVIVSMSIIFALLEWWTPILDFIRILDIRLNFEGYLWISSVLFVLWVVVFFLFDNQVYMVFTPGQLKVRLAIGDAETAYDTTGMTIQKQRSDLFRHWILGLGSGDLLVNTAGAQVHHFDMPNVLFIGRKVRDIEQMLSTRQVVAAKE